MARQQEMEPNTMLAEKDGSSRTEAPETAQSVAAEPGAAARPGRRLTPKRKLLMGALGALVLVVFLLFGIP